MRIFFSVGEPSGDLHGANLIRALQAADDDVQCVGYGGPKMAAAGCVLIEDTTRLAVMWLTQVVLNLHRFLHMLIRADRMFRDERPDAVVLIDYPGFNWWIARRAKARGIPVFYYGAPQIWAWAGWRIKKMRRLVDHTLCKLPFEERWYRERGCKATYVGHPYFDELEQQTLDTEFIENHTARWGLSGGAPLITILPGSRTQEVTHNVKWLFKAAASVRQRVPNARFAVASYRPQHEALIRDMADQADLPIEIFVQRTPELIQMATCCMAVSGSVSLELLYHTKPTVILYWVNRVAYVIQSYFKKVKYITLVNLLSSENPWDLRPFDAQAPNAEKVLMPEYLTCEDKSEELAEHVIEWVMNDNSRRATVEALERLKSQLAQGGASKRAAEYILGEFEPLREAVSSHPFRRYPERDHPLPSARKTDPTRRRTAG